MAILLSISSINQVQTDVFGGCFVRVWAYEPHYRASQMM